MNRLRILASFIAIVLLILLVDSVPSTPEKGQISLNVNLEVEPWASWLIPTDPVILSSTGNTRSGIIKGVSFGSNNADGFYIVAEMDNGGHLANAGGIRLINPLKVKFPNMTDAEPMVDAPISDYSNLGYIAHLYPPDSYYGNMELIQEISPNDTTGDYTGTVSVFMTYSIGEAC